MPLAPLYHVPASVHARGVEGNRTEDDRRLWGAHQCATSCRDRGLSSRDKRREFDWRGKMSEHGPSRGLLLLTSGVLLAGTLLLPYGTRDVQSKKNAEPQQRR